LFQFRLFTEKYLYTVDVYALAITKKKIYYGECLQLTHTHARIFYLRYTVLIP